MISENPYKATLTTHRYSRQCRNIVAYAFRLLNLTLFCIVVSCPMAFLFWQPNYSPFILKVILPISATLLILLYVLKAVLTAEKVSDTNGT